MNTSEIVFPFERHVCHGDPFCHCAGRARLTNLTDGFIYTAPGASTRQTRRHAAVLLVALNSERFRIESEGRTMEGAAVIVAPNVDRTLYAPKTPIMSVHLDPQHAAYRMFAPQLGEGPLCLLDRRDFSHLQRQFMDLYRGELRADCIEALFDELIDIALRDRKPCKECDPRMSSVVATTAGMNPCEVHFDELVTLLGVSPSRLSHLFKQNIGLSLRSFRLWLRIRWALNAMVHSTDLTTIAHDCGFSDSAHFSRAFHGALGLRPSFMANNKYVQVTSTCDA